ncbi:MAG TPA: membrane protein insertion efficiency factor YidD [Vulgatibacter sp.]
MIGRFAAALLALPIRAYRALISPFLPASCRFHPSCSSYALQALEEHGAWRGLWLAARRLGRCHPFHAGGIDPVPSSSARRPEGRAGHRPA